MGVVMHRSFRVCSVIVAALLGSVAGTVAVPSANAATSVAPTAAGFRTAQSSASGPILNACYNLKAGTANDRLVSGNNQLVVSSDQLSLDQFVVMNGPSGPETYGETTWAAADVTGSHSRDGHATTLAFYCSGELALTDAAGTMWRSNTAGRGGVRLALTTTGNLVMYNSAGGIVWQTGTGRAIMAANSILPSNSRLASAAMAMQGDPVQTLAMQTDGNLVYREGSTVKWQTNTRVRGSRAVMTTAGELRVLSPSGTILWRSGRTGSSYSTLTVSRMEIMQWYPTQRQVWAAGV